MSTIRLKKTEIFSDPLHNLPFLEWVQEQVTRIENYAEIIEEIEEEGATRSVISLAKVNECMARYTWCYTVQTAFYQIYKKKKQDLETENGYLFDKIYMVAKGWVTDKYGDIGEKYVKKGATVDEIKREAAAHPEWPEYIKKKEEIDELDLKLRAQLRNLDIIKKMDINLQSIKKTAETEIKYLHLE